MTNQFVSTGKIPKSVHIYNSQTVLKIFHCNAFIKWDLSLRRKRNLKNGEPAQSISLTTSRTSPTTMFNVLNSPVRGQHNLYEPDEVDGGSSAAHNLQGVNDARLPHYDRDSTMDTYIQSYLEVGLLLWGCLRACLYESTLSGRDEAWDDFWCMEISHASWLLLAI